MSAVGGTGSSGIACGGSVAITPQASAAVSALKGVGVAGRGHSGATGATVEAREPAGVGRAVVPSSAAAAGRTSPAGQQSPSPTTAPAIPAVGVAAAQHAPEVAKEVAGSGRAGEGLGRHASVTISSATSSASVSPAAKALSTRSWAGSAEPEYTYYDDPARRRAVGQPRSNIDAFSREALAERQRALAHTRQRIKCYPWDVVKRVTGIYADVTQQL